MSEPKDVKRPEYTPDQTDAFLAFLDTLYPADELVELVLQGPTDKRLAYAGKLELIAELKQLRADEWEERRASSADPTQRKRT